MKLTVLLFTALVLCEVLCGVGLFVSSLRSVNCTLCCSAYLCGGVTLCCTGLRLVVWCGL